MNIKITHSWLLDYLETDATPEEIQKYLSLCGPSVERIEEKEGEVVYDIEITSNRIDTASVMGIAQEAAAILPMFGKKATLKKKNLLAPDSPESPVPLTIVDENGVCKRVLGIVMHIGAIDTSPPFIAKRLRATDTRSLNNIVDITNYVMTEIGHPTHVFDYDRIASHRLILRHAKKGEEIVTLDEKKYTLNPEDIIIDDGTGKVIDLPGIMGTANSVVTNETKRILFFIESNDPVSIRRTSMRYGIRTMASTINEKGPDSELAYTALLRGIELYKEIASAKVLSPIIDIYPNKRFPSTITTSKTFIDSKIGTSIPLKTIVSILTNLQFAVKVEEGDVLIVTVPTSRISDVTVSEDIVEEVARVYGYFAIPSELQTPAFVAQPKEAELLFHYQYGVKTYLKHRGFTEVMNYSAVSKELLHQFEEDNNSHLSITNSISEDIKYLRKSLIPSLVRNVKQNEGFVQDIRLFELAKTYLPTDSLPIEEFKLSIATTVSLDALKAALMGLMKDLNIDAELGVGNRSSYLLESATGEVQHRGASIGFFGQVKPGLCRNAGVEKPVYVAELSFKDLMHRAKVMADYKSFSQFAHITQDITVKKTKAYAQMRKIALASSRPLESISVKDQYEDMITLRLTFTDRKVNITEDEVKKEVEKIKAAL